MECSCFFENKNCDLLEMSEEQSKESMAIYGSKLSLPYKYVISKVIKHMNSLKEA